MRFQRVLLVVCLAGGAILGCGDASKLGGLRKVTGKVTMNGSPVSGATVAFAGPRTAAGTTNEQGVYSLATQGQPGAAPGDYTVTVSKSAPAANQSLEGLSQEQQAEIVRNAAANPPKSELPEKYMSPATSGLKYVVRDADDNVFDIVIEP